jgi:hypothetical protein
LHIRTVSKEEAPYYEVISVTSVRILIKFSTIMMIYNGLRLGVMVAMKQWFLPESIYISTATENVESLWEHWHFHA